MHSPFTSDRRSDFFLALSLNDLADSSGIWRSVRPLRSDVMIDLHSHTARCPAVEGELDKLSGLALAAAKDFNDELTFILNHAEVSMDLLGPQHPANDHLNELQHSAVRCAEITRCLLLLTLQARESVRYATVRTGHEDTGD